MLCIDNIIIRNSFLIFLAGIIKFTFNLLRGTNRLLLIFFPASLLYVKFHENSSWVPKAVYVSYRMFLLEGGESQCVKYNGPRGSRDKYNFRKVIRQCVRPLPEITGHGLTSTFHL